jgi:hypothetical protein
MKKYLLLILILAALYWSVNLGIKKTEKAECLKWAEEAQVYPNYYLTDWQEAQCQTIFKTDYQGIELLNRIYSTNH